MSSTQGRSALRDDGRYAKIMKTLIATLFTFCSFAVASEIRNPAPKEGFANATELNEWAQKSAFGGGWAKEIVVGDRRIFYSNRSFTSGRETTQVTFFYTNKLGRIVAFYELPIHLGTSSIDVVDENIIVNQKGDLLSKDIIHTLKSENIPKE
jgi:hypothetical protein